MVTARPGFSLVETAVAAMLLSIAVLSVATGGAAALHTIAAAEREQGALTAGMAVIDSLAQSPTPGNGRISRRPFTVDWEAVDTAAITRIRVTVRTTSPPHDSILTLAVLASPPPPIRF